MPPLASEQILYRKHTLFILLLSDHNRLTAGREGLEFPQGTPKLEWSALDVSTFKPFTRYANKDRVCSYAFCLSIHTMLCYVIRMGIGSTLWPGQKMQLILVMKNLYGPTHSPAWHVYSEPLPVPWQLNHPNAPLCPPHLFFWQYGSTILIIPVHAHHTNVISIVSLLR
jgi:hypothetical protein